MSEKIILKSDVYTIKEIKKKTTAKGFSEFESGDKIIFSMVMRNRTNIGRGNFDANTTTTNLTKDIKVVKTQSNLINILNHSFELEKCNE